MFPLRSLPPLAAVWIALNPTQVTKSFTGSVDFHLILLQSTYCSNLLICLNVRLQLGRVWVMPFHLFICFLFRKPFTILKICLHSVAKKKKHPESHYSSLITSVELLQGCRSVCTYSSLRKRLCHSHSLRQ